ncbi:MAG TPA: hypothetical protein PK385_12105 [Spirochaetota bacterium]|jgi:hypothetical protein|nr:MAG: hypothetical protein BWX91_02177 [Spirochaetes bacterium ADurb.Bin133]HNZ27589.1 hypothetical protein [Spirochaetota bacterium]HOF01970.1 hypothetical protein [Spirochaetota bacterium]HOS31621.1 hypothetical protein [Spirochaetota bacterium]HOS56786.1 hypothetical protein [Spirochaetota bacterium]
MQKENSSYKITLFNNLRYLALAFFLFAGFVVNLFFFYLFKNLFFLFFSIAVLGILIYSIYRIKFVFDQIITLHEDRLVYNRTRYETETINFKDIKLAGYYKKDIDIENFKFGDGLYVYDAKNDNYIFVGTGFSKYQEIFNFIKNKSSIYRFEWRNIKKVKGINLVGELKKIAI